MRRQRAFQTTSSHPREHGGWFVTTFFQNPLVFSEHGYKLAAWSDCQVFGSSSAGGGGVRQLSGTKVMPDFCGVGADFPESGFCQLSGTKVMPDFCGVGAAVPGAAGTTVRAWQAGQGICRPAY
jgi:hypothetical protein